MLEAKEEDLHLHLLAKRVLAHKEHLQGKSCKRSKSVPNLQQKEKKGLRIEKNPTRVLYMATKRKAAIKLPPLEEIKLIKLTMYLDYNKATAIEGVISVALTIEKIENI